MTKTQTKSYIIIAHGCTMGIFEATSPELAVDAMDREAGYESTEHAAHALETTAEAMREGLTVRVATAVEMAMWAVR